MSAVTSGARLAAIPALNRVLAAHGVALPAPAAVDVVDVIADTIARYSDRGRPARQCGARFDVSWTDRDEELLAVEDFAEWYEQTFGGDR